MIVKKHKNKSKFTTSLPGFISHTPVTNQYNEDVQTCTVCHSFRYAKEHNDYGAPTWDTQWYNCIDSKRVFVSKDCDHVKHALMVAKSAPWLDK